ncbi:FitA-like ribbon-helix-helix domain-containing protein [Paracoccus sp. TD-10]
MAQIVMRQIPDEVHRALKAQAAAHGHGATTR